jgi:hypothetical protein
MNEGPKCYMLGQVDPEALSLIFKERDALQARVLELEAACDKYSEAEMLQENFAAKLAALEPVNHRLLEALKEYIAAADNSMMPEDADDVAAMLRFGEADKQARAAIAACAQAQPVAQPAKPLEQKIGCVQHDCAECIARRDAKPMELSDEAIHILYCADDAARTWHYPEQNYRAGLLMGLKLAAASKERT